MAWQDVRCVNGALILPFSCFCRLYSCLANGSPDEFQRGEQLYRVRAVKDPLQIGEKPLTSHTHPPKALTTPNTYFGQECRFKLSPLR